MTAQRLQLGVGPDDRQLQLTASAEPAIVFASLAARCVPAVCDRCAIDIAEAGAEYRIAYPPTGDDVGPGEVVRLPFAHSPGDDSDEGLPGFEGIGSFAWHNRVPSAGDRVLVGVLIEHAVRTVAWQRSEQRARIRGVKADNLDIALQNSRQIGAATGVLMSVHKITQTQAFDLLRLASQRSHRKLRDLALDVLETGWLDPALVEAPTLRQHAPAPEQR